MHSATKDPAVMRQDAASIFNSAVRSVHGETVVKRFCRIDPHFFHAGNASFKLSRYENIYVIGAGKASAHMAKAIEDLMLDHIREGKMIVKYGHGVLLKKIRLREAGHPIPDKNGWLGARHIVNIAEKAGKNDLIICLMSGGGSALLPLPVEPLTLEDKQKTINILLACGASIDEINTLRKHMSMIKGGRLAQKAHPATMVTLIISDVPGDRLEIIASGPTVADPSAFKDCMEIIAKYQLAKQLPAGVMEYMRSGHAGNIEETPKPGNRVFSAVSNFIIGSNADALSAAKRCAESLGYHTMILSSMICGNTRDAALFHASIAKEIRKTANPLPPPACILSGGETTVKVTGSGLGGRNQEFALATAIDIQGQDRMVVLCAGTDGTDGPTDAAGAVVDSMTAPDSISAGSDPASFLNNNDSYHFFKNTTGQIITGPTGTNVMDLRIVLVG
ncbi:MAG: glycerate kinase [Desulfobacterales bacterium]|jgi:hydroxypyruvate reductase|nr:glycerate kinase [Desulfobacterales bacterium]